MQEASMLVEKRWALLDVEFIRISATHRCIRKLYILCDNGFIDMELEFFPCVRYKDLQLNVLFNTVNDIYINFATTHDTIHQNV